MMLDVHGMPAYCYTGGKTFTATLPTAVFVHGAQNDHSVWVLQSRYFAHHGFGVLAVDLPGHGRSHGAPLVSVEAMADWLDALLTAVQVECAALLIGHSMGSLVALQAAARRPTRAAAVALVGSTYPMRVSDELLHAARVAEQQAIDMVALWSHSGVSQKPSCPGPGFSLVEGSRKLMRRIAQQARARDVTQGVFLTDFQACNTYTGGETAARALTCPVLLLLGAQDQMTPPKSTAILRAALPHARVVEIASCGHALMAEQPDAVLDTLFAFATAPASQP